MDNEYQVITKSRDSSVYITYYPATPAKSSHEISLKGGQEGVAWTSTMVIVSKIELRQFLNSFLRLYILSARL
jgi:hypothetical protein